MGIRTLEAYLRERKLSTTCPLEALRGTRLGIDASHYIKTLLSDPDSREPLVAATGGTPLALNVRIENDLRALDRLNIKPVFVFSGLPLASRPPPKGVDPQERETHVKQEAWNCYENGDVEKAVMTLASVRGGAWTDYKDVVRLVLRQLRHRYVEYMVAPYLDLAQLAYLLKHPKGYIHAIYSSNECLLFPVDKVITSIDFGAQTMRFIDKSRLLADVALSDDQFLDLAILSGCSLSRTFPSVAENFTLRSVIDLLRQYKSGIAITRGAVNNYNNYSEVFMRARLAVKYSLILTAEGSVRPLPLVLGLVDDIPPNLDEIFSPRLPDEVYFLLCKAFVSPQLLGWLTSGMIVEPQPLADSPEYRRFIRDVITEGQTSPRCTALALLSEGLHPQWKSRRVYAHYYNDPIYAAPTGVAIPYADLITRNLVERCNWSVASQVIESELRRQNSSTIDIKLCLGALPQEHHQRTVDKKDEMAANIIWRFLDVRGFVADRRPSTMGKAMHAACTFSRVNDRFQEPTYLLLELLRAGVVHGNRFGTEVLSGGPSYGSDEDQASALLVMRCMSVLPLVFRSQQWAGPLSRELLAFNSFVRAISKAMRQLIEAIGMHLVISGEARRTRDDYLDILVSLPFQTETNTGCGILIKTYLDAAVFHFNGLYTAENADTDEARAAKKEALGFIEHSFSSVKLPLQEIDRGFRFWDTIMVAIRTLVKEQPTSDLHVPIVAKAVADDFERADKWLRPMRP